MNPQSSELGVPAFSEGPALGGPLRVLVVDDELLNRRVLRAILRRGGYTVREAADGEEALAAMRQEPADLVLLDVMMPGRDGYAVCAELKGDPAFTDMPVIFLSARDELADRVRGFELGASDYITKPFEAEEVLARVRTHLRLRQLTLSLRRLNGELLARQARLEEDLRAAADIQRTLLPREPLRVAGLSVAWRFEPCGTVGGDIFNLHRLGPSHVGVYMLDVSGHGVPAAMVTVSVDHALLPDSGVVLREEPVPPAEVLRELDREYPFERFDRFFTISYLLVDAASGTVRYSSAAHPPPVLVPRQGPVRVLTEGGPLIGLGLGGPFTEGMLRLSAGDRLFLFTDGVYEVTDAAGREFGRERLHALLEFHRPLGLEALCDEVMAAIKLHRQGGSAQDDITLLALEFHGAAAPRAQEEGA